MEKKITINPVTRIEGHAKIVLTLGEDGKVAGAEFCVNEFRGFEKFCEGRYYTEMPSITPRICGICPTSHSLASVKACDAIQKVAVPRAAKTLRRLMEHGQLISSHGLSFFYLSAPDLMLGWDYDPAKRNILGIAEQAPDFARRGIRVRKFGQEISQKITGKKIHSMGVVAGGMAWALKKQDAAELAAMAPEVIESLRLGIELFQKYCQAHQQEVDSFANHDSLYMGLTGPEGQWETYDGRLKFTDAEGRTVAQDLDPADYLDFIAERPVDFSYLKYPYYRPFGFEKGFYRVGPLARLNVVSRMNTPLAQAEFEKFRAVGKGKAVQGIFYYHWARLIEMLAATEEVQGWLKQDLETPQPLQSLAGRNQAEGVGCCEAPRGTLFHHYVTDETGKLTNVNLLIATGQNNPGMNQGVLEVARQYVDGTDVKEEALNRVEAVIRCYDPCLSCASHQLGRMPLKIELRARGGEVLKTIERKYDFHQ